MDFTKTRLKNYQSHSNLDLIAAVGEIALPAIAVHSGLTSLFGPQSPTIGVSFGLGMANPVYTDHPLHYIIQAGAATYAISPEALHMANGVFDSSDGYQLLAKSVTIALGMICRAAIHEYAHMGMVTLKANHNQQSRAELYLDRVMKSAAEYNSHYMGGAPKKTCRILVWGNYDNIVKNVIPKIEQINDNIKPTSFEMRLRHNGFHD